MIPGIDINEFADSVAQYSEDVTKSILELREAVKELRDYIDYLSRYIDVNQFHDKGTHPGKKMEFGYMTFDEWRERQESRNDK